MAALRHASVVAAAICATLFVAAHAALPARITGECVDSKLISSGMQAFPSVSYIRGQDNSRDGVVQVKVAQFFTVAYYDTYKVVNNTLSREVYVLHQCGLAAPDRSQFPNTTKFFEIPLTSVSVTDATAAGYLEALGLLDRVAYTTSTVVDPCSQSLGLGGCKKIAVGPGGNATVLAQQMNDVDAIFVYSANANRKSIAFPAVADPGALNRVEWLKFMAVFFNKEVEANELFNQIDKSYRAIASAASTQAPADASRRPVVAWMQWTPGRPFYTPTGRDMYSISFSAYRLNLTEAAGGRMLSLADVNRTIDLKQVNMDWGVPYFFPNQSDLLRAVLKDVDVVIDESRYLRDDANGGSTGTPNMDVKLADFLSSYGLEVKDTLDLKFLRNSKLLRTDGVTNSDSYTDWFQTAVWRPDQVVADIVAALYPTVLQQAALSNSLGMPVQLAKPRFLRNLFLDQPVLLEAKSCPIQGCRLPGKVICPYVYAACNGTAVYATSLQRCAPTCTPVGNVPGPSDPRLAAGPMAAAQPILLALLAVVALMAMIVLN